MKSILLSISILMIISICFSQHFETPIIPSNKLVYGLSYINFKDEVTLNRNELYSGYFGYEYNSFIQTRGYEFLNKKDCIVGFHYSYPYNHTLKDTLDVYYKSWDLHFLIGDDLTKSMKFDFYYMIGLGFKHSSLYIEDDKTKKADDDLLVNLSNILRYNLFGRPTFSIMVRYGINIDLLSTELIWRKNNINPMLVPYVQLSLGIFFGPK